MKQYMDEETLKRIMRLEAEIKRLRELLDEIYEKYGVSFDAEMIDRLDKELSDV